MDFASAIPTACITKFSASPDAELQRQKRTLKQIEAQTNAIFSNTLWFVSADLSERQIQEIVRRHNDTVNLSNGVPPEYPNTRITRIRTRRQASRQTFSVVEFEHPINVDQIEHDWNKILQFLDFDWMNHIEAANAWAMPNNPADEPSLSFVLTSNKYGEQPN